MEKLIHLKKYFMDEFRKDLEPAATEIKAQKITHQKKAQQINKIANLCKSRLFKEVKKLSEGERTDANLTLQYCFSVASLEYRNQVWPYEYMAFSRRVGELWEGFCSAAWDEPKNKDVKRIKHPSFNEVKEKIKKRLDENLGTHDKKNELKQDIDILFNIIGNINMKEDEVFLEKETPCVIDFKSGFGSNEKGNMLRLQTVGEAYKLWNIETNLMLIVRQPINNNYLKQLENKKLWSVYKGEDAYNKISEITGADINHIRKNIIKWETDLSPEILNHLKSQPTDLRGYLAW